MYKSCLSFMFWKIDFYSHVQLKEPVVVIVVAFLFFVSAGLFFADLKEKCFSETIFSLWIHTMTNYENVAYPPIEIFFPTRESYFLLSFFIFGRSVCFFLAIHLNKYAYLFSEIGYCVEGGLKDDIKNKKAFFLRYIFIHKKCLESPSIFVKVPSMVSGVFQSRLKLICDILSVRNKYFVDMSFLTTFCILPLLLTLTQNQCSAQTNQVITNSQMWSIPAC